MNPSILSKFLIEESLNLDRLSGEIRAFNPFEVLGAAGYEIRHSNFLAWVMSPNDSHGLGDFVLKSFLSRLEIPDEEKIEHFLDDFNNLQVFRELDNIDILIVHNSKKWVLLIENKVWAPKTGENQLVKYFGTVREKYSNEDGWKIYPVYLTAAPRGLDDAETNLGFQNFTYFNVLQILKAALESFDLDNKVADFIHHYCKMVNTLVMNTEDSTVRLAQEIYRKHREAIEYIISKKPIIYSKDRFEQIKNWVGKQPDLENISPADNSYVRFLPKKVKNVFIDSRFGSWQYVNTDAMFSLELYIEAEQLRVKFCFGAIYNEDENLREKLQNKKTAYFEKMKAFRSLKGKIVQKARSQSRYPAIAWVELMNVKDKEFMELEFMEAFEKKFSGFRDLLDKWTEEVMSELVPIQNQFA